MTRTNTAFDNVADTAAKVAELVAEIAAASSEQAQGIEQVNLAVSEMDKVVQQNASSAEESASASEEMNAQAEQMKAMVGDLIALVEGKSHEKRLELNKRGGNSLPKIEVSTSTVGPKTSNPTKMAGRSNPEQVFPLRDDDFQDF
jgi:methyl-accepting chemotaxis protein